MGEDQIKAARVELKDLRAEHASRRSSRKGSKVNKEEEEYQVDGERESDDGKQFWVCKVFVLTAAELSPMLMGYT